MTTRLFAVLLACLVALPGIADAGPGRARLSTDLQDEVRKGNRRTVEVIVDGDDAAISRLLGRHPLELKRRLRRGAVLEVPAGQLESLAADRRRGGDLGQRRGHLAHGADDGDDRRRRRVGGPGDVAGRGERLRRGRGHHRLGHLAAQRAGRQGGGERRLHAQPQPRPRPRRLRARHARRRHRRRGGAGPEAQGRRRRHGARRAPRSTCACSTTTAPARWPTWSKPSTGRSTNRAQYAIRVINLSLGTPVTQSYRDDPHGPGGGARRQGRHRGGGVGRQPRRDRRTARRCSRASARRATRPTPSPLARCAATAPPTAATTRWRRGARAGRRRSTTW